jgi:DNA-binding IclR family transcriptional regulator
MSRERRDESAYAIDVVLRTLKVLEALEGTNFEPVNVQRVQQRTGFSYDFCRRALLTLKKAGYVAQTEGGWTLGNKILLLSQRFNDLCIAAMVSERSEISDLSEDENRNFSGKR